MNIEPQDLPKIRERFNVVIAGLSVADTESAWAGFLAAIQCMQPPKEPPLALIERMCVTLEAERALSLTLPEFKARQESNRVLMVKLYEEAMGQGCYPANKWFIQSELACEA